MDNFLPATLLDIIESVGKRNSYNGFKIYSSGSKTNIIIHFLDTTLTSHAQSAETESRNCSQNAHSNQLKSAASTMKKRSPCNQIRDQSRVKDYNKDISPSCAMIGTAVTPHSSSSLLDCSLAHDNLQNSPPVENCKQCLDTATDKRIPSFSNMDFSSGPNCEYGKPNSSGENNSFIGNGTFSNIFSKKLNNTSNTESSSTGDSSVKTTGFKTHFSQRQRNRTSGSDQNQPASSFIFSRPKIIGFHEDSTLAFSRVSSLGNTFTPDDDKIT